MTSLLYLSLKYKAVLTLMSQCSKETVPPIAPVKAQIVVTAWVLYKSDKQMLISGLYSSVYAKLS